MTQLLPPISDGEFDANDLSRLLVGTAAPVILEVGANDGTATARFLQFFPNATVYAFEPDPRALAKFKSRGHHPRVRLFEMAIGADDGEAEFHVSSGLPEGLAPEYLKRFPQGWDQSGSLRAPKTHTAVWPWVKFEKKMMVPVRRLDTWAREQGIAKVDFIWADMQGAEADLIAGGRETLARTRYLHTEYSNDEWYEGQPTLAQLMDMLPNFTVLRRYAMDVLFANTAMQ
jgi:FkbM family methyltransferase